MASHILKLEGLCAKHNCSLTEAMAFYEKIMNQERDEQAIERDQKAEEREH